MSKRLVRGIYGGRGCSNRCDDDEINERADMPKKMENNQPIDNLDYTIDDNEDLFRSLLSLVGEWLYIVDRDMVVIYANQAAVETIFYGVDPVWHPIGNYLMASDMLLGMIEKTMAGCSAIHNVGLV